MERRYAWRRSARPPAGRAWPTPVHRRTRPASPDAAPAAGALPRASPPRHPAQLMEDRPGKLPGGVRRSIGWRHAAGPPTRHPARSFIKHSLAQVELACLHPGSEREPLLPQGELRAVRVLRVTHLNSPRRFCATSTQLPPLVPLQLDLRHLALVRSMSSPLPPAFSAILYAVAPRLAGSHR